MRAVRDGLLLRTEAGGLLYVAELHGASLHPKFDHLVCFLPGGLPILTLIGSCFPMYNPLVITYPFCVLGSKRRALMPGTYYFYQSQTS